MIEMDRRSETWTFFEGRWHVGNIGLMGPRTHAAWMGSCVFDGARAFSGVCPDLGRHLQRVNNSAAALMLKPCVPLSRWLDLARDGVEKFPHGAELYIRPMYWAEGNGPLAIAPDPGTTQWCLTIYESPLPKPTGSSITLSPFRRPTRDTMPLEAKAGCLYPNNARAIIEARNRGFDNCVMCDMLGNVAELANSNIFAVRDNVVYTPIPNGTFLNGITRQRVIQLLRASGTAVIEGTMAYHDLLDVDEIFSTANHGKVMPVTRIEERKIAIGPVYRKARELYWAFAHSSDTLVMERHS
jgi:branched-chain amino acid aminotransferase